MIPHSPVTSAGNPADVGAPSSLREKATPPIVWVLCVMVPRAETPCELKTDLFRKGFRAPRT